ncbi:hypothetical protein MTP99_004853 [Tenebrio molitor]|nr:hypothetical protein MTP99_004853 [Tenebrio molitor]
MHSYFPNIRQNQDDCLGFVYTITVKFFENKVVKTIIVITLIFQIIVSLINTSFFIKYFDFKFFNQFISNYLAFMRFIIFNGTLLWKESSLKSLYKECQPFIWSIDSTTKETEKKIKNESKIVTVVHLLLSFVSSIILLPSENEKDYHFTIYLFRQYFKNYTFVLEKFFFATFPVVCYTFVYISHVTPYAISHTKFQMYMLLDCINYLTAEYEDEDDVSLLKSDEYQKVIKERLRFFVIRHIELKR